MLSSACNDQCFLQYVMINGKFDQPDDLPGRQLVEGKYCCNSATQSEAWCPGEEIQGMMEMMAQQVIDKRTSGMRLEIEELQKEAVSAGERLCTAKAEICSLKTALSNAIKRVDATEGIDKKRQNIKGDPATVSRFTSVFRGSSSVGTQTDEDFFEHFSQTSVMTVQMMRLPLTRTWPREEDEEDPAEYHSEIALS